jgi:Zn2+/Cd2+-exporting ATPase
VGQQSSSMSFKILGMDCAEEIAILKREVGPLVGGEAHLTFDLLRGKMTVVAPPAGVTADKVVRAVAAGGLRADPWETQTAKEASQLRPSRSLRPLLVGVSGGSTVLAFALHALLTGDLQQAIGSEGSGHTEIPPLVALVLYTVAILSGIWLVLPKAWSALRHQRPDMNLLMVVAVAGAVGINEWFEAATVAFLFAFSALLESWSVSRARRAIASLLDLSEIYVLVRRADGTEIVQSPDDVPIGARFVVKPGEKLPLDGLVVRGSSEVNEAPITGESRLVEKTVGSKVFAGTLNGNGALHVESTALAQDTAVANIIRLVEESQSRRAPSEQWVETFAKYYTPAVMAGALLFLLVPPLLLGHEWFSSIYNALVLLVIACPCALVISTPVTVVAGLTAAARRGVLIKGGVHLEAPARLTAIAFDKTGTLTRGQPAVSSVVALNGHTEAEVLERAAAMEGHSDHPLAKAIIKYAKEHGLSPEAAADFQLVQGKGATAQIDGQQFWIGSHKYLEERGQETKALHKQLVDLSATGNSVVVVGNEDHVCGFLALTDEVRPQAHEVLRELRQLGLHKLVMLTGDNRPTAESIGQQLGIDEVYAELLPSDKVKEMERLVAEHGHVAMIGDGINDAPALARASVSIAMGAAGSDAALETADIALMADDLGQLPWLVRHSKRTIRIIRQNIAFSLAVKILFVGLTFVGLASLWAAIAADMGASLLVIANGLRLLTDRQLDRCGGTPGLEGRPAVSGTVHL